MTKELDLVLEQKQIELNSVDEGLQRYYKNLAGRDRSDSIPETLLISEIMPSFVKAIEDLQYKVANKEKLKGIAFWGYPILSLPADKLAMVTLICTVNNIGYADTPTAFNIGEAVRLERTWALLKTTAPDVVSVAKRFAKGWSTNHLKVARRKAKMVDLKWSKQIKLWVGVTLLETLISCQDHITVTKVNGRKSGKPYTYNIVELTPEAQARITLSHEDIALLKPTRHPMVCPPMPWESLYKGGYLMSTSPQTCASPLIKSGNIKHKHSLKEISDLGLHGNACTILQKTHWRVSNLLNIYKHIYENNMNIANIPTRDLVDLPPFPDEAHYDMDVRKQWRQEMRTRYVRYGDEASRRILTAMTLDEAERYKKYNGFYYVWNVCFRGRMYPDVSYNLSPQGDSLGKSLIEFVNAKPLTDRGFYWLTIHLANNLGKDKLTLDERFEYVMDNRREIERCVNDPLSELWWTRDGDGDNKDAGKFLLAAKEWVQAVKLNDPGTFESRVPVTWDGTCNGMQWLSALGRDIVGATATNLRDLDTFNDLYGKVAEIATAKNKEHYQEFLTVSRSMTVPLDIAFLNSLTDPEMIRYFRKLLGAAAWYGKITRKVAKQPTMTKSYGVTKQGIREQIINNGFLDGIEGNANIAADYIRDLLWSSINETNTAGTQIMDWLQEIATIATEHGQPVQWTSPANMLVTQRYLKQNRKKIMTQLKTYNYFVTSDDNKKLLPKKQSNSISPNFIHSMDSAHMAMVIHALYLNHGITDMSMNHDSYGTHACHGDLINRVIRAEMVSILRIDWLSRFHENMQEQLGMTLPPPPPKGEFDVNEILRSKYAWT